MVLDVDWATLSSGVFMLKDDDSLREASRVASHSASPGTIIF